MRGATEDTKFAKLFVFIACALIKKDQMPLIHEALETLTS